MLRTTRSIKIDPSVWKEVKVHCAKKDITYSEFIEQAIKKELGKK